MAFERMKGKRYPNTHGDARSRGKKKVDGLNTTFKVRQNPGTVHNDENHLVT